MRKPWMKNLQAFRFNAEGTMTTQTATAQRCANSRAVKTVGNDRDAIGYYAEALGVHISDARKLVQRHKQHLDQHIT